jgi:hypothetical protein
MRMLRNAQRNVCSIGSASSVQAWEQSLNLNETFGVQNLSLPHYRRSGRKKLLIFLIYSNHLNTLSGLGR